MSSTHSRNGRTKRRVIEHEGARQEEVAVYGDATEFMPLGREALEIAKAWAVIGLFLIVSMAIVEQLSLILKPVALALVVGMILGMVADRMGEMGIPRFGIALILSGLVMLIVFLLINALISMDSGCWKTYWDGSPASWRIITGSISAPPPSRAARCRWRS